MDSGQQWEEAWAWLLLVQPYCEGEIMEQNGQQEQAISGEVSMASTTLGLFSPRKMLVESATMIFIIAFMLFAMTLLIWKGKEMGTGEMMAMFFGLILTATLAIRQYAAFRY